MTALKKIDEYPITRSGQQEWAKGIMQPLKDGEVYPLEFITKVRGLQSALQEVEKDKEVKDIILREISKQGKQATWNGATLAVRETGVKYDYSACNDPVYAKLIQEKEELDKKLKEREAFLKSVPAGTTVLDEETGEVYQLYPAVRMALESYAISFAK